MPRQEWRFIIQLFAADSSAAVARADRKQVIVLAKHLAEILIKVLKELGLEVSIPKCNNFIFNGIPIRKRETKVDLTSDFRKRKKTDTPKNGAGC